MSGLDLIKTIFKKIRAWRVMNGESRMGSCAW